MSPNSKLKIALPYHVQLPNSPSTSTSRPSSSPDSEQGHSYPPTHSTTTWSGQLSGSQHRSRYTTYRGLLSVCLFLLLLVAIAALGGTSDVVEKLKEQKDTAIDRGAEAVAEWRDWLTKQAGLADEKAMDEELYAPEAVSSESDIDAGLDPAEYAYENVMTDNGSEEGTESGSDEEQQNDSADESEYTSNEDDPVAESSESGYVVPATGSIKVSALPRRPPNPDDKETKYLGYIPHSGFHNQRIELENALLLGFLLNRTVLVPPVWMGEAVKTLNYDQLDQRWTEAMAEYPRSFALESDTSLESELSQPLKLNSTQEDKRWTAVLAAAKHRNHKRQLEEEESSTEEMEENADEEEAPYDHTFVAWDFISDLDSAASLTPIVDRWDMRPRATLRSLGLEPSDVYVLRDMMRYDFMFSDVGADALPGAPLISLNDGRSFRSGARKVSVGALRELPERLLLIGTMFGSKKIRTDRADDKDLREHFSRAMTFRNPWLVTAADDVAHRLGDSYNAIHARVADGGFIEFAQRNMRQTWFEMMARLGFDRKVTRRVWNWVRGNQMIRKRKRQAPLEDAATLNSTLRNLVCRGPLWTQPELAGLNKPLYLATDSRDPVSDPLLAIFFKTFPCIFILSDFDRPGELNSGLVVDSVEQMGRLENENDNLALGKLLLPFLEAVIAAKADIITGTTGSTFSGFAEGAMHRAYLAEREP